VATGDTLVSMTRPNLNAVALVPEALDGQIASTGFDVLRPKTGVDPRWLAYLVRCDDFVRAMSERVQGALYPAVRSKDVRNFVAPLAPQAEQTRIADQLDTLLARIQACNDRLRAIPALLRRLRQAVVNAGIAGDLTADRRPTEFIAKWASTEVQSLCEVGRVITYGVVKLGDELPDGTPCLRTSNVRWLRFENDEIKRIAPGLSAQYARTVLRGAEVLVNVRGTLGGVAVATPDMTGWNVSREIAVLPVDVSRVNPEYVALWIASDESQSWLGAMEKGVAYVGINIEDLRKLPIRLPLRDEQDEIVKRVKACLTLVDRIEARLSVVRASARRMTSLALAKAFRGELVPQDPSDEPALALLARIAAQRAAGAGHPQDLKPRRNRPPRAPKETAAMTKSRQDDDVMGQPYLANHLRRLAAPASAEALFKVAELPIGDFYKQLAWEVALGHVKDNQTTLEPGHAAG